MDRTVELLDEYNIIDIDKTFENFNEYTDYSKKIVSKIIENYYRNNSTTPYYLKAKGLDEKLSNEELLIVLLHYAKHRGYKSNRQDNDERKSSEAGLVKSAIKENEELLKKYRSISEMFIKDEKFKNKIRNTTDSYKMCVTREMVRQEILMLLENQFKLNVLPHEFIEKYIGIWSSQRLFSEGPGYPSKYGGDLIVISLYGLRAEHLYKLFIFYFHFLHNIDYRKLLHLFFCLCILPLFYLVNNKNI